jgi:hypothetical protein
MEAMMRKNLLLLGILLVLLSACGANKSMPTPVDISALQTAAVQTVFAGANQTATANAPTNTPQPTDTPIPTPTNTPLPNPLAFNGQGDNILDINKWNDAGLLHIKNTGYGNFAVWNYDKDGNKIDLLVNTIGNYEGYLPLDFVDGEQTTRLEIKSDGQWAIEIYPFDIQYLHVLDLPGKYNGNGDDVLVIRKDPDIAQFDCQISGNFAVWAYGASGRDLVVNEIAPYNGKVILNKDAYILVVTAPGAWSVEISTR